MKLMNKVGSLFAKSARKPNKKNPTKLFSKNNPPSFSSSTTSSSSLLSSSDSPKTVLRDRKKMTKKEVEHVLRRLGCDHDPLTDEDVGSVVDEVMTLEEASTVNASIEELRDAFKVFDENGDGKISAEELRGFFVILEEECGIDECRRMIESVDSDGDGLVCFDDFVKMMMDGQR